ncbi:serine hydrolase [Paenibacillus protaetiae]|uniref:Beta-lactamase-related domain-containing protein n=1 Tax=Paenibacillus protaetiae TaxID=2509456 RepID=A0A4P6ERM7_9BACL|nr:serine hydrolase [Paenibacillus protaetiae]QAY65710.1 hypothetical protein ET464_04240 [Paenibacillus protaetiae]
MQLYAKDLAQIGLLYLNEGIYGGKQLLNAEWVKQSVKIRHKGLLHYEPPIYGSYGYHWWISPQGHNGAFDCYFAFGFGGQYLLVAPEARLVVVLRKQATGRNQAMHAHNVIFKHIAAALI